jgi:hypothetical protein
MNHQTNNELCDLVRNYSVVMEGMISKAERNKYNRLELIDRLIKRSEVFIDALWTLRGKHVYTDKK